MQIAEEDAVILKNSVQLKRLMQKIDMTIVLLLTAVYFLQFLNKTTLLYTAVMRIQKQTHLIKQNYLNLSMLFYIDMNASFVLFRSKIVKK